jgi:hypothetical protein
VVVSGDSPGRLIYAKSLKDQAEEEGEGANDEAVEDMSDEERAEYDKQETERELSQKREKAHELVNKRLFEAVLEKCASSENHVSLLRAIVADLIEADGVTDQLVAAMGWAGPEDEDCNEEERRITDLLGSMGESELIRVMLAMRIGGALRVSRWSAPIHESLQRYLEVYRIDPDEMKATICTELGIPLPSAAQADEEEEEDEDE